jgi:hypothetical protein
MLASVRAGSPITAMVAQLDATQVSCLAHSEHQAVCEPLE